MYYFTEANEFSNSIILHEMFSQVVKLQCIFRKKLPL